MAFLLRSSVRLSALDRTYTVNFDPPNLSARPNFIKIVDINGEIGESKQFAYLCPKLVDEKKHVF